jgi:hypothetical protein
LICDFLSDGDGDARLIPRQDHSTSDMRRTSDVAYCGFTSLNQCGKRRPADESFSQNQTPCTDGADSPVICCFQPLPRFLQIRYLGDRCRSLMPLFPLSATPVHLSARDFDRC